MSGRSSIESLRQLARVSDVEAAAVFGAAGREELLEELTRLPVGRRVRRQPIVRRRPFVLAVAFVATLATAAAAWAIFHTSAQETTSVECVIKGVDTIIPATSGDPAADCAVQWKRDEGTAAPPLRAYDNGDGGVTVIPSSETPPAGFKRLVSGQDVDLIQLQASLDDFVNGLNSSCLSGAAATSLTEGRLSQFGLAGWTVSLRDNGSAGSASPAPAETKQAPREKATGTRAGTSTSSTRARRPSRCSQDPIRTGELRPASPTRCDRSPSAASRCRPPLPTSAPPPTGWASRSPPGRTSSTP